MKWIMRIVPIVVAIASYSEVWPSQGERMETKVALRHETGIVQLPKPHFDSGTSVERALLDRRSVRGYRDGKRQMWPILPTLLSNSKLASSFPDGGGLLCLQSQRIGPEKSLRGGRAVLACRPGAVKIRRTISVPSTGASTFNNPTAAQPERSSRFPSLRHPSPWNATAPWCTSPTALTLRF